MLGRGADVEEVVAASVVTLAVVSAALSLAATVDASWPVDETAAVVAACVVIIVELDDTCEDVGVTVVVVIMISRRDGDTL